MQAVIIGANSDIAKEFIKTLVVNGYTDLVLVLRDISNVNRFVDDLKVRANNDLKVNCIEIDLNNLDQYNKLLDLDLTPNLVMYVAGFF